MIDEAALRRFRGLIRARAGLALREQETALLARTLAARIGALQIGDATTYLDFLSAGASPHSAAPEAVQSEWKQLWMQLTNQESYFFRDAEQLSVIRDHVLPEIMRRNAETRTLRLWSAGCSTGEEPYSLAMMTSEIPALRDWRVTIVGTDISEAALERARRGVYGQWSFRALDDAKRARFFSAHGNKIGKEWEIAPHLRRAVVFAANNLLGDEFPVRPDAPQGKVSARSAREGQNDGAGELHDIDLIVCRNVFIYFGREAVAQVLRKFGATLRPGGFLVCGHAELHDAALGDFQARAFPQSVIYQRESVSPGAASLDAVSPGAAENLLAPNGDAPTRRSPNRCAAPATLPPQTAADFGGNAMSTNSRLAAIPASASSAASFEPRRAAPLEVAVPKLRAAPPSPFVAPARAQATLRRGEFESRAQAATEIRGETATEKATETLVELCARAQTQANAGQLEAAEASCARASHLAPFAAWPYQVRARIAEERGEVEIAKSLFKKVIYLSPRSVSAALELGAIYARQGDASRAAQMRRTALEILEELGENGGEAAPVPAEEHALETPLSVGELKRQLLADSEAVR